MIKRSYQVSRATKASKIEVGDVVNGFTLVSTTFKDYNGSLSGEFLCHCGGLFKKTLANLERSQTIGCSKCVKKHSKNVSRVHPEKYKYLYKTWKGLNYRCNSPKNPQYPNYGERGIKVCEEWSDNTPTGFVTFCEDMGPRPADSYTVDRIDNSKGYCKENCRWASQKEQANNKRSNVYITYEGVEYTLTTLANIREIKPNTLNYRLRRGWSLEEALEVVPRRKR